MSEKISGWGSPFAWSKPSRIRGCLPPGFSETLEAMRASSAKQQWLDVLSNAKELDTLEMHTGKLAWQCIVFAIPFFRQSSSCLFHIYEATLSLVQVDHSLYPHRIPFQLRIANGLWYFQFSARCKEARNHNALSFSFLA